MQLETLQGRLYAEVLQSATTYTGHYKPTLPSLETLSNQPLYMLTDNDGFDLIWRLLPDQDILFLVMQQNTALVSMVLPYDIAKKYHPFST